jgi:hypothetical protein
MTAPPGKRRLGCYAAKAARFHRERPRAVCLWPDGAALAIGMASPGDGLEGIEIVEEMRDGT